MKPSALATRAAARTSSSVASSLPKRTLSAIGPGKEVRVLQHDAEAPAQDSLRMSRTSMPS